jgi:predicted acyl esterase
MTVSDATLWEGPDPAYWVPRGYACLFVDARGTGRSEGKGAAFGPQTANDYAEVIAWAADQPWSTGKVGLNGVSGLAANQYHVACRSPRGLAAIIPWEGFSDFYRDVAFPGGVPETGFTDWYLSEDYDNIPGSFDPPETVNEGTPPAASMLSYFEPIDPSKITVPLLECATWSDQGLHTRGGFNIFNGASSKDKYLYTHGRGKWTVYNSPDGLAYQLAFFDRFLKGEHDAMRGKSRVRLEVRKTISEYEERGEDSWPPAGTRFVPYYLGSDGDLSLQAPGTVKTVSYPAAEDRPAQFSLSFDKDTEISGPAALKLWVSTDAGEDIDLFVGLRKFDSNGAEVHFEARENDTTGIVANGCLRVTQRKLDPVKSRPERPFLSNDGELPVVPGEVYEVDVEILPSSTLFEAGSRLVLNIGGRDIWWNRMCQHRRLRNHGTHTIHLGSSTPSHVLLPIVDRG